MIRDLLFDLHAAARWAALRWRWRCWHAGVVVCSKADYVVSRAFLFCWRKRAAADWRAGVSEDLT